MFYIKISGTATVTFSSFQVLNARWRWRMRWVEVRAMFSASHIGLEEGILFGTETKLYLGVIIDLVKLTLIAHNLGVLVSYHT